MSIAHQIALWADKLRDISAWGLRYSQNQYDTERYQAIQDTSIAMVSLATGQTVEELEPLRETLFSKVTPNTAGVGAVIDAEGRILLIRRANDGLWALPSGGLEVGETAAEGTAREVFEETAVRVKPTKLIGIFDSRCTGQPTASHIYGILFLCELVGGTASANDCTHAGEVLDVQWFEKDALPDDFSPGHAVRIPVAYRAWEGADNAYFDPQSPEA